MKVKFKVDRETGEGYVAAIEETTGEHRKAVSIGKGQEIVLDVADVLSADQIGFGDVVDSESGETVEETPGSAEGQQPADTPGGGNEGSPQGGQQPADGQGDAAEAPQGTGGEQGGQDGAQEGEQPTTSAASEKPLYKVNGDTIPEGFVPSGLETPGDETLYHFNGDTEGQAATGNVDGVSVYADADDNEKPVQPAADSEAAGASS